MLSAPNAITLSCKSRPPRRPPSGGAAAAATNMQWRERTAAAVTPAVQFGAAEPGLGGFCQLVRAVRPLRNLLNLCINAVLPLTGPTVAGVAFGVQFDAVPRFV